ncbi:MAG TPA: hypothetical protein VN673_08385 [Clostridia bacterium]|nr:hypothetical protein [Clostridia bacterium]
MMNKQQKLARELAHAFDSENARKAQESQAMTKMVVFCKDGVNGVNEIIKTTNN